MCEKHVTRSWRLFVTLCKWHAKYYSTSSTSLNCLGPLLAVVNLQTSHEKHFSLSAPAQPPSTCRSTLPPVKTSGASSSSSSVIFLDVTFTSSSPQEENFLKMAWPFDKKRVSVFESCSRQRRLSEEWLSMHACTSTSSIFWVCLPKDCECNIHFFIFCGKPLRHVPAIQHEIKHESMARKAYIALMQASTILSLSVIVDLFCTRSFHSLLWGLVVSSSINRLLTCLFYWR